MRVLLSIVLSFILYCRPLHNDFVKRESQKNYEGFLNDNTFQVNCNSNLTNEADSREFRNILLDSCRKYLVVTLAKFKIAYDYNTSSALVVQRKSDPEVFEGEFGYSINIPSEITNVNQIKLSLSDDQILQLLSLYGKFLPGKITQEWNDGENLYIIYAISGNGLINIIKNTDLPFGIQF